MTYDVDSLSPRDGRHGLETSIGRSEIVEGEGICSNSVIIIDDALRIDGWQQARRSAVFMTVWLLRVVSPTS